MKKNKSDVDIDCFNRDAILRGIGGIFARIDRPDGNVEKHPSGVYFQNIPRDPVSNISTIDYRIANDYGYFKIDFLNVNMYEGIRDEAHLLDLLHRDVPWDFFEYKEITDQLFHLKGHSDLLQRYKPKSVEDLAIILAIIRPSKAYLQNESWNKILNEVWVKVEGNENYQFKKAHAISYALAIVVNLNLLLEQMSKE